MDNVIRPNPSLNMPTLSGLGGTPNSNATPQVVGRQFESMFASVLLKQLRQTADGESMFGKDAGDVVGGMFDHFLGEHIGRSGGLGVSQMIRAQLERRAARS